MESCDLKINFRLIFQKFYLIEVDQEVIHVIDDVDQVHEVI
jgi:hypothetical protein